MVDRDRGKQHFSDDTNTEHVTVNMIYIYIIHYIHITRLFSSN